MEKMNNKLNVLFSITRHDIINKLTALMANGEFLKSSIKGGDEAEKYLQSIIDITEWIVEATEFSHDYQDLGVKSPKWVSVDESVRPLGYFLSEQGIDLKIESELPEIYADPLFEKVLYNMFENSVRHGGHVTEIRVYFNKTDGILVIEDNGKGVAESDKKNYSTGVLVRIPDCAFFWQKRPLILRK